MLYSKVPGSVHQNACSPDLAPSLLIDHLQLLRCTGLRGYAARCWSIVKLHASLLLMGGGDFSVTIPEEKWMTADSVL